MIITSCSFKVHPLINRVDNLLCETLLHNANQKSSSSDIETYIYIQYMYMRV